MYNITMNRVLNIVNGVTCIRIMKSASIEGDYLPWIDFLHEGPVPPKLNLDELSKVRANFIADNGYGKYDEVIHDFKKRNKQLYNYLEYDKIVLWFEHDLYDQLQLLQVLSWFATQEKKPTNITLISTNQYLSEASEKEIHILLENGVKVTEEHLQLSEKAWNAFREPTPTKWFNLLSEKTSILPFLKGAIFRMLEEYPNTKSGLSRTQHQALLAIKNGMEEPYKIFQKSQSYEERKFMGDIIFVKILKLFGKYKVIESHNNGKKLTITPLGLKLLTSQENWLKIHDINHSIGGVALTTENLWCWDLNKYTINQYYYSKMLNEFLLVKQ